MRGFVATFFSVGFLLLACGGEDVSGDGGSGTASGGPEPSSSTFSSELKKGIATFYDADGAGNCSFERSPGNLDVVALNMAEYAESALCGGCMKVTGPKGSVTVRVVDSCPPCERNHLDLSEEAFVKIADRVAGRVEITYQTVACEVAGPLAYHFKEGSSKWWTAIQVRNHSVPVAKLEYQKAGAWVAMKREDYNYFVESDGVGDTPGGLRLRVTAADGRTVEDSVEGVADDATLQGAARL